MEKTPGGTSLYTTLKHRGSVGSAAAELLPRVCYILAKSFGRQSYLTADREPSMMYIVHCMYVVSCKRTEKSLGTYYLAIDIYGGLDYFSTPYI